jgi:signal transduction histidine kinase
MLSSIDTGLQSLEIKYQAANSPAPEAGDALMLQRELIPLMKTAYFLKDSQDGFDSKLREAQRAYRTSFVLVCVASAVVLLLFLGLVVCGYRWIFAPLQQLHQGACRVAQGDFDYRVRLNTNDEMAELADAFNQMTARFQEIADDLDRQVQERSRELIRSARLASVGFLAAGVAHEINNPLTAIKWTAESLTGRFDSILQNTDAAESSVARRYLEMIHKQAMRCQQITAKLLDFARGQQTTRTNVDITALVGEVVELVSHISHFRDRQVHFLRTEPCFVEVNASEIAQVVLNLISNALESMDAGGLLEIDVLEQTDQVVIVFRDNGCGMTAETLENLFEPFFTQKRSGQGTGLGLSISHRIVRDHGGRIEATSEGLGCGSTFRVSLPRRAVRQEAAA